MGKLIIILIILVLIYYLIANFTTIRYNLLVYRTQLLDKIKKNKRLHNIDISFILKFIESCLELLQAPFMNVFNSSSNLISKIIRVLIRFLSFVKDILLYYISKKK